MWQHQQQQQRAFLTLRVALHFLDLLL